ncbi:MAG: signal peptidase I [Alphaproteobacteria bacterium]|nr:signal peptidase I [Alphaproteobacteria bacterium]
MKSAFRSKLLREFVQTIVVVAAIVFVVRTFLFQPFRIPSGSMEDTLLVGDYIIVSKYPYGYSNYSIPFAPDLFSGRIFASAPARGDVVVFAYPANPSIDYIKRIVGLPGDRIRMTGGVLYVNGTPAKMQRVDDFVESLSNGMDVPVPRYRETLPDGSSHEILDSEANGEYDDTPEFIVPPGHYFMMGDNRDRSNDSRVPDSGVGFVPEANIIGRAEFVLSSWSCSGDWDCTTRLAEVWTWPWTLRTDRILHAIK